MSGQLRMRARSVNILLAKELTGKVQYTHARKELPAAVLPWSPQSSRVASRVDPSSAGALSLLIPFHMLLPLTFCAPSLLPFIFFVCFVLS